jgi:DNA-binding PadR family transcriptional regulator
MQCLIRERHKNDFLDLKRGSLYHAIERLLRAGWIEELETSRQGRRPERTVYRLTPEGERELLDWLRELIARPVREASQFVAAMSFVGHLTPEDTLTQLQLRERELECGLIALEAVLQNLVPRIGRLPLVEVEYALAMKRAELAWVRSISAEIREGKLTWDADMLLQRAQGASLPDKK